jgi:predicted aspartyl protease
MSERFDPTARSVLIPVFVVGLENAHRFRFAIDTGANRTSMRAEFLRLLGFNPSAATRRRRMRSATGMVIAPIITVPRIVSLGLTKVDFEVAAHDPPESFEADGLLGLDFFRGYVLNLDFIRGRIALRAGRWWQFWR